MNNTGVIILSRYSSSRLPGKALMEINGKKVLEYIIERVNQVFPLDKIVIATSNEKSDDAIADFAKNYGVGIYRGSLDNVAERFFNAAKDRKWEYAVRINGDNIFMDTDILASMTAIADTSDYDFISNVKNRTFPKGMSIEIVKLSHYELLLPVISADKNYKEHVTLYLYEHEEKGNYHFVMNTSLPEAAGIQMALDTQEDFERTQYIIQKFIKPHFKYNLADIFHVSKNITHGE